MTENPPTDRRGEDAGGSDGPTDGAGGEDPDADNSVAGPATGESGDAVRAAEGRRPVPERVRVESGRPPSEAVLRGVEAAAGIDLAESEERLGDVVDTDALDALFGPAGRDGEAAGHVEFAFCGCRVTVESDGRVHVVPTDAS